MGTSHLRSSQRNKNPSISNVDKWSLWNEEIFQYDWICQINAVKFSSRLTTLANLSAWLNFL